MKIAAFIPAKGTSNRVPNKNMQKVLGVPLFLWAANNLARVLPREDIYIDSEDDDILELARANGFGVLQRPQEMASNATDGNQLMIWEAEQVNCDICIQHLPPMIFLREETLRKAIQAVIDGCDSSFAAMAEHLYTWSEQGPDYDVHNIPNSNTLPITWIEGMGLYVVKRQKLLEQRIRVAGRSAKIPIDRYEAVDIDYPEDLDFARQLAQGLPANSEYTKDIQQLNNKSDIQMLVLDVDGVLTDGGIYLDSTGTSHKRFNAKDGIAIRSLLRKGVHVFIVSGSPDASIITPRAVFLGIPEENVLLNAKDKLGIIQGLSKDLDISPSKIAYIGDDINDLEPMKWVRHAYCPSDSAQAIRLIASVMKRKGGEGCVAELVEILQL